MSTFKKFLGSIICICSSFFVVMAVVDIARGGDGKTEPGVLAGLLVFFSGTFLAGARMYRSGMRDSALPAPANAAREVMLLQFARETGGTVGAADVGARLRIPFSQARLALEDLRKQGACELVVTEHGAELYRFPDLAIRDDDNSRQKDLLER